MDISGLLDPRVTSRRTISIIARFQARVTQVSDFRACAVWVLESLVVERTLSWYSRFQKTRLLLFYLSGDSLAMCGITGGMWFDSGSAVTPDILQRMTDSLVHRGPDDSGTYLSSLQQDAGGLIPGVALGFRRLSIIDLEHGAQPMSMKTEQFGWSSMERFTTIAICVADWTEPVTIFGLKVTANRSFTCMKTWAALNS